MTINKNENLHVLRILDAVSRDGDLTQRSLSQRLGVALGFTNLYLKRLVKKGYIKVVNIKPNRLRYELTPSGIAQKTTLAFQYVSDSYAFVREARRTITAAFAALQREGVKSVAFYGSEELAEIAFLSLEEVGLHLAAVVDPDHEGRTFCGRPVRNLDALAEVAWDRLIVVDRCTTQITDGLRAAGVDRGRLVVIGAEEA
jgi:DNA-binding MarR family transcriptional regulator